MRSPAILCCAALLTVLAGCVHAPARAPGGDADETALPSEPSAEDAPVPVDGEATEGALVAPAPGDAGADARRPRAVMERGSGKFVDEAAASRPHGVPVAGDVTFNFEGESIQAVIKAILGDFLQENYVIAPGVQGTVTFATSKPINANQARAVLDYLLSQNGLVMVWRDGRFTVLPQPQAIPGNLTPRIGPANLARGYEVRIAPLKFVGAAEMVKLLQPFTKQGAIISADTARSLLILAGTPSELQSYLQTIEVFDVDWLSGMSVGIFPLERVEAKTIVPELEKVFGEGGQTPLAGMFRFMPIERMNAVLVITPQPRYLEEAERWLSRLDRGGSEAGVQLYVYYVRNVKATDLADNLTDIFSSSRVTRTRTSGTPVGSVVPGVGSVEVRSLRENQKDAEAPPREVTLSGSAAAGGGGTSGGGINIIEGEDIRITAIEESNALLIRATPPEYGAILAAIKRLDIVPLQVHIEAKILQVALNDTLNFGVRWFFENQYSSDATSQFRVNNRGFGSDDEGPNAWNSFAGTIGPEGLLWTFVNTSAEAVISTLQSVSDVEFLGAPSLVVLNNKEASINVGTQIPVVSTFFNPATTTTTPTDPSQGSTVGVNQSFVQFRDTGIILTVTPRVNPGGLVFMEISQEQSTPGAASTAVAGNVPVDRRTIETEVAVQSGETVLLGGLIRETRTRGQDGVPGVMKIPIIGRLFSSSNTSLERAELLVMITPTVIENVQTARELTEEYRERFRKLAPMTMERADELIPLPERDTPPQE
jgi:general secretion pathway protein D